MRAMKKRASLLVVVVSAVALISVVLTGSSHARGGGATQISGIGYWPEGEECDSPPEGAHFAILMDGDLQGCLWATVEGSECSPDGTYREWGTETFVGYYNEEFGTFDTTYLFTAKYDDCPNLIGEIFGRCQHPIVAGSGTDVFEGVTGRLDLKDDIEAGTFPYRGHLRW